jgi:acyl-CoA dehydrogenase
MSDPSELSLLQEALNDLLAEHCAPPPNGAGDDAARTRLWAALTDMGVPGLGVPEDLGGSGGDTAAVAVAARLAGAHSVPLPLVETNVIGGWAINCGLVALAGHAATVAGGPDAPSLDVQSPGDHLVVSGRLARVPWASAAEFVVAATDEFLFALPVDAAIRILGHDLADDERDDLIVTDAQVSANSWVHRPGANDELLLRAACARVLAMDGAARRALALSVTHCRQRVQFGQPLARFQAVQQLLAQLAGASAQLQAAAHLAEIALATGSRRLAETAATTAGPAAAEVVAVAHQVHGAIGLTSEHALHRSTRHLLAWRDEFGSERYWARRLGEQVTATAGEPWHALVPA